jgi:pheromone a factor receptor
MFGFGVPKYPQYPIISFICALIILLPVSSHWKARNVATLSMIAWLFVINVTRFINTLVWANNVIPRWKVYCDISEFTSRQR